MKSEERHELVQNDLEKLIERLRSRYTTLMVMHGNRILLWISVVLLLIAASIYYSRTSRTTNADGWSALAGAQSPEDLAGIAEAYAGTNVGDWARLKVGEQYLQAGVRLQFNDREASVSDLKEAQTAFEELLNRPKISDTVRERALYGLARTLEATSTGDLKPAIEAYQKLLNDFPETAYQSVVEKQIKSLENQQTQEFYAWFATQKPKPQDREQPSDLMQSLDLEQLKSEMNSLESSTPETPAATPGSPEQTPLTVPTAPDFPPTGEAKPEMKTEPAAEPATPTTPEAATPPVTTPPANPEKPATETPAAEPKPAAAPETPAAEQPSETTPAESGSTGNSN